MIDPPGGSKGEDGAVMMTTQRKNNRARNGAALVLTLVVIVVLVLVGQGLLALTFKAHERSEDHKDFVLSQCAADAGVERALFLMNERLSGPWSGSDLPAETNQTIAGVDATYSFTVESDGSGGYIVNPSTGVSGDETRTIYAGLGLKSPFEHAILVKETIDLKADTIIDAVNSNVSLNPADVNEDAPIGTSSTVEASITLHSGIVVNGPVFVGPGGDTETVIKDLGGTTGQHYVLGQMPLFPVVVPPSSLVLKDPVDITNDTQVITPTESGEYPYIDMGNSSYLVAQDGDVVIYVTGDILMGQGSELIVKPNSTLTIYFDGDFIAGNSNGINSENKVPYALKFYATSGGYQKVELKAKGDFYGAVYAPNADVLIHNAGDIYGAIVGETFTMMNSGTFYYDAALSDANVGDEGVQFKVTSWREE
jgi:hypothetical protein